MDTVRRSSSAVTSRPRTSIRASSTRSCGRFAAWTIRAFIRTCQELQRLQSTIAEGLKRFEFGLRRRVDANEDSIALTGSDEVPEEFRRLVQEYYRSLARTPR